MVEDPRIQQMLDVLLDSRLTPEEVCSTCPELLPQVRERWRRLRLVQDEVDALFPPQSEEFATIPREQFDSKALPQVSGYELVTILGRGAWVSFSELGTYASTASWP